MENKGYVTNVDSSAIEEQNANLKKPIETQQRMSFDAKNYLNLKLEKHESTKTLKVRLLPISLTDNNIFFTIKTHALKVSTDIAKSGFKSFVCLNDPHVGTNDCPICQKAKELFEYSAEKKKEGNTDLSKEIFKEACSLKSKTTFIVRVIDRDHEDEGVKFWRFNENSLGEGIYDKIMSLYETRKNESIQAGQGEYSIFDLYNGKDIIINLSKQQIPDGHGGMKDKVSINITDSGFPTPLSNDIEKANGWLSDPKTWKDVYSNKTSDYISLVLEGKVPVYDKENGCFVAKDELEKKSKKEELEASSEILNDTSVSTEPLGEEELPF